MTVDGVNDKLLPVSLLFDFFYNKIIGENSVNPSMDRSNESKSAILNVYDTATNRLPVNKTVHTKNSYSVIFYCIGNPT